MADRHDNKKSRPARQSVDLTQFPDLVVIYLGMRANTLRGLKTLLSFGPKIQKSVDAQPDGLLLHENIFYSFFPLHGGMRQYWRDFESLERWARTGPHAEWWKNYLGERGGTGFWHETYFRGGQVESVFIDMPPVGLSRFAPTQEARGSMFSARRRLGYEEESQLKSPIEEQELYGH
jgi:hypothetical protein